MYLKYAILDEIECELLKYKNQETVLFNDKQMAMEEAVSCFDGWQIIEIPFYDDE